MYRLQFKDQIRISDSPIAFCDVEICLQGEDLVDGRLLSISQITELQTIIENHYYPQLDTIENYAHLLWHIVKDNLYRIKTSVTLARVCVWASPSFCVKYSENLLPTVNLKENTLTKARGTS